MIVYTSISQVQARCSSFCLCLSLSLFFCLPVSLSLSMLSEAQSLSSTSCLMDRRNEPLTREDKKATAQKGLRPWRIGGYELQGVSHLTTSPDKIIWTNMLDFPPHLDFFKVVDLEISCLGSRSINPELEYVSSHDTFRFPTIFCTSSEPLRSARSGQILDILLF